MPIEVRAVDKPARPRLTMPMRHFSTLLGRGAATFVWNRDSIAGCGSISTPFAISALDPFVTQLAQSLRRHDAKRSAGRPLAARFSRS